MDIATVTGTTFHKRLEVTFEIFLGGSWSMQISWAYIVMRLPIDDAKALKEQQLGR